MNAATLRAVARWCDDEYRRLCMLRTKSPDSEDAMQLVGKRAQLAELAGSLRSWADSGRQPTHHAVSCFDQARYEREATLDEQLLDGGR